VQLKTYPNPNPTPKLHQLKARQRFFAASYDNDAETTTPNHPTTHPLSQPPVEWQQKLSLEKCAKGLGFF